MANRTRPMSDRRPRPRVFDVMIGASVTALIGVIVLYLAGVFDVSGLYEGDPIPRSSTARNECQALVIDKIGDEDPVTFDDDGTSEELRPDRSWVIRGPVEIEHDGETRAGEYVCEGLRELPPGSDHWRSDRVIALGV